MPTSCSTAAAAAALLLAHGAAAWESCPTPDPLTDAQKMLSSAVPTTGPGPYVNAWLGALTTFIPEIFTFEGPIAVRTTMMIDAVTWSCAASYSETWNDGILVGEAPIAGRAPVDLHTSDARVLCALHAFGTLIPTALTTALPVFEAYSASIGVPVELGAGFPEDPTSDIAMCFDAYKAANAFAWDDDVDNYDLGHDDDCPDVIPPGQIPAIRRPDQGLAELRICLSEAAACTAWDPAFVGPMLARFIHEWFYYDGHNAAGDISADGTPCTANCRPYSDYTGYVPVNHAGLETRRTSGRWQPLEEDNGNGFFYRQEHVTPQIGFGVLPRVLSRREVRQRKAPKPRYNFKKEAKKVVERLGDLTDEKKTLIEFFDSKLNLALNTILALSQKFGPKAPFEALALYLVSFTVTEHDAELVVWKEKVRWDSVRTTTVIQAMDKKVETFAGPGQGVKKIKARDFQPYIRVMPHAEYPSGSACLCEAYMDVTESFIEFHYGDNSSIPFALNFPAGSSRTEPGVTPAEDVNVFIPNTDEIRQLCGESRLDGGMHFRKAVPEGYKLCEGIGSQVQEQYAVTLTAGESILVELGLN